MSSTKPLAYTIKNIFAIIIALFVLATMTLTAQDKAQDKKCDSKEKCANMSAEAREKCMAAHSASDSKKEMTCSKEAMNKTDKGSCCSNMNAKDTKVSPKTTKPWNAVCPVLGKKVNPKVNTVEYNGKAYGFCCPGCDTKFKAEPEKYSSKLSKDGKKLLSN